MEHEPLLYINRQMVSILTRGKPRVEHAGKTFMAEAKFQSSLEGNPEWNKLRLRRATPLRGVSILTRGKPRVER